MQLLLKPIVKYKISFYLFLTLFVNFLGSLQIQIKIAYCLACILKKKEEHKYTEWEKRKKKNRLKIVIAIAKGNIKIDEIMEIRTMRSKNTNKERPMLVGQKSWNTKIKILRGTKKLNGSNIYITEVYPKEVKEMQKELCIHLKQARAKAYNASLRYNKLLIYALEQGITREGRR